jgi:hypothetical protein
VAKFSIPQDVPAIATFSHTGTSNFAVWTVGSSGDEQELLVNDIGSYKGTRLFDVEDHSVAFKVTADGSWSIVVKPISMARAWNPSTALTGTGDDVVRVAGTLPDLATALIKHSGSSNFAVVTYTALERDLLVNEIGKYSGEVLLDGSTLLVEVTADGKWSIAVQ